MVEGEVQPRRNKLVGVVCGWIPMLMEVIAIPREPVEGSGLESPLRAAECSFPTPPCRFSA